MTHRKDDIVNRLLAAATPRKSGVLPPRSLYEEAAAEIARLYEALRSGGANRYWEGRWRDEAAENERLRAALKELLTSHDNLYLACFGSDSDPRIDIAAKPARALLGAEQTPS